MTLESAVAAATALPLPDEIPNLGALRPRSKEGLSPRELEVLHLMVAGQSNKEIAEALFISDRTVTTHVTSVFSKLGVSTRSAAAVYAVRHRLVAEPEIAPDS